MTDKTTEALKLAEEAAEFARNICLGMNWSTDLPDEALAAIREALAEPVKQEPVGVISESAIGLVKLHANGACLPFGTQLYAAPVSAEPCKECDAKQAKIDSLMLEYCPDEITDEQMAEWSANQKHVSECRHCGWLCMPNDSHSKKWYPMQEPVKQEPVARPFECWSTNDGDSWFEHPADAQLIYDVLGDDPKVGDEFEVSAGWNCVTATYQIASKDGDDFEVKCVSHPNNDTAPVSAEAIRAEALEEAAKVCEQGTGDAVQTDVLKALWKERERIAEVIRGLK